MIDIQQHIDKLNLLSQYMDLVIEDKVMAAICANYISVEYNGKLKWMWYEQNETTSRTFEEWLKLKQQ